MWVLLLLALELESLLVLLLLERHEVRLEGGRCVTGKCSKTAGGQARGGVRVGFNLEGVATSAHRYMRVESRSQGGSLTDPLNGDGFRSSPPVVHGRTLGSLVSATRRRQPRIQRKATAYLVKVRFAIGIGNQATGILGLRHVLCEMWEAAQHELIKSKRKG
jgi:hypothetical protein